MSIKYVVLGYLSWRPMTGYEVKKTIAESETLPWSANDNQIYRALVQLHDDRWVRKTIEGEGQNGAPNRRVYAITDEGVEALRKWAGSAPERPYTDKPFLNQLMWADCLDAAELDQILEAYLNAVGEKLFFIRVQADEKPNTPERTPREGYLWDMIHKHWIAQYEIELKWIRQMRRDLQRVEARAKLVLDRP